MLLRNGCDTYRHADGEVSRCGMQKRRKMSERNRSPRRLNINFVQIGGDREKFAADTEGYAFDAPMRLESPKSNG